MHIFSDLVEATERLKLRDEQDGFRATLVDFPNSFQMQEFIQLEKENQKREIEKLERRIPSHESAIDRLANWLRHMIWEQKGPRFDTRQQRLVQLS